MFEKGVSSFRRAVLGVQSIISGFGFATMVKDLINVNVAFERVRLSLLAGHNSAAAAAADFEWVRREAIKLGIPLAQVGMEYSKLNAAAKGTALQGEPVRRIFDAVGKSSIAMGLDVATTQRVFMALTQMLSKGRVQAEEARQQFGEHLPGGFKALAVAAGYDAVTGLGKFQKALSKGQVDAVALLTKLPDVLEEMFGSSFEAALTSPQQAMKSFKTAFDDMLYNLGQKGGFMREFTGLMIDLRKAMASDEGTEQINRLSIGLGNLMHVVRGATVFVVNHIQALAAVFTGSAVTSAIAGIRGLTGWIGRLAGVSEGATLVGALTNPFLLFAGAVGLAAGALVMFNDKIVKLGGYSANALDWLQTGFQLVGERIQEAGKKLEGFFESLPVVGPVIKTISADIGNAIRQLDAFQKNGMKVDFGVVFNSFKENFRNLLQPMYDWLDNLWLAVKNTFVQVASVMYENFKAGINNILGLFGSDIKNLPDQLATWFGKDVFHNLVTGARIAIQSIIAGFLAAGEIISAAFKLATDIIKDVITALNPVVEQVFDATQRVAVRLTEGLSPSEATKSAWSSFTGFISSMFDAFANVVVIAFEAADIALQLFAGRFEGLVYFFTGIANIIDGITIAVAGFFSFMSSGSDQMNQKANESKMSWVGVLDLIVGGFIDAMKVIGLVIEWIGILVETLGVAANRIFGFLDGIAEGLSGILIMDPGMVAEGAKKLADAFVAPLPTAFKTAVAQGIKDVQNLIEHPTLHPVSDAFGMGKDMHNSFMQFKEGFGEAMTRFQANMDKINQGIKQPETFHQAGMLNAQAYADGFFNEWAKRATDLTSKKTIEKMRLEEEQKRLSEANAKAYQDENDSIDRNLRPDLVQNANGSHGKSPSERAQDMIRKLMVQQATNNDTASTIKYHPNDDVQMSKAMEFAGRQLSQSGFDLSYSQAINGTNEMAKKLAKVAVEASLAQQHVDAYEKVQEDIGNNNRAIAGLKEQALMSQDLSLSTQDLSEHMAGLKALQATGLNVTYAQATAVDQYGKALDPALKALVDTAEAQEHWNYVVQEGADAHKKLRENMQTFSEFASMTNDIADSTAALDEHKAELAAQHAVMELWKDDIYNVTRLNDPFTKSLYDQTKALQLAGGSAENYAGLLRDIADSYRKSFQSEKANNRFNINDRADSQRQQLKAGFDAQVAGMLKNNSPISAIEQAAADYRLASSQLESTINLDLLANSNKFSDQLSYALFQFGRDAESVGEDVSKTFDDAFSGMSDMLTDFVTTGKLDFRSLAQSIIADISRMIIKWMAWQVIKTAAASFGIPLPFANGGVMSSEGSMPLKKYAGGGIATSPQLAMFGEGSRPEAYVPLPDGRTIPVTLMGDSMGSAGMSAMMMQQSVASGVAMGLSHYGGEGGGGGGSRDLNINVNVSGAEGSGGAGGGDPRQSGMLAKKLSEEIRGIIVETVQNEMRPGGTFNPMGSNKSRF